ncbi:MAG: putative aliphatic sulfonates transport permease protein SsuC [Pseudomonadota bacterium]|jgi:sulfonate transport system permease protein
MSNTDQEIIIPRRLRGWVLPLALLACWWWAVASGWSSSLLLVSPLAVWWRAVD